MTLVYMNSFGQYTQDGSGHPNFEGEDFSAYSGNPRVHSIEDGRGYFYYAGGSTWTATIVQLKASMSTMCMGFNLHGIAAYRGTFAFFVYRDDETSMLELRLNTSGNVVVTRGGTTVLTSTGTTANGTSDHWQVKVVFHNSDGEVYLYKNGTLDSSVTGVDTLAGGSECDGFYFAAPSDSGQSTWGISDLWIDDADLHGVCTCVYEPCDTSGSASDFTGSGSSLNEENVDEYQPDDDSTYNYSTTLTDKDSLKHTAGTYGPTIVAVGVVARARKPDANSSGIKLGVKHSASETQSSTKGISTSYQWIYEIFDENPSTTAPWEDDELDDAETSYQHVSV